jgi:hypothetical protein
MFRERINEPNAQNNALINYSLKITNYQAMQETLEMLTSGFATLLVYRSFIGARVDGFFTNYLGQKRGPPVYS